MLDALGEFLNPYSDVIGAIAGGATTLHSVSKAVFLNDIRKRGTADGFSAVSFLGGIVITILNLELSLILGDTTLVRTNIIGLIINIACMSIFYIYSSEKARSTILKQFAVAAIFISTCIIYALIENPANIEKRFSLLLIAVFVVLLGTPLLRMGTIIRKKSSENLPFPMIVAATIIVMLWLTYAISIKERVLIYQNGLLMLLLSPQLIVCLIYPRKPTTVNISEDKTIKKD